MNLSRRSVLGAARFILPCWLVACSSANSNGDSSDLGKGAPNDGDSNYESPQGDRSQNAGASPSDAYSPPVSPSTGVPTDAAADVAENDFVETAKESTSTFAIDVDTGSYSLMRRDVTNGTLPGPTGVRPEEYINYFKYDYAQPDGNTPFSVQLDGAPSAFGEGLHLVRVGVQGKEVAAESRQHASLVFLVDVSGSMQASDKLGLVQYSLKQLVKRLEPTDTLAIVTYAGSEKVLLDPTPVNDKSKILDAIDGLVAGGGTNGEGGIRKAYQLAEQVLQPNAINRVVLCSDGDFNVGATGSELISLIEKEREKGIFLTTLGFGTGNYQDQEMEALADHGNGNYAYIDGPGEANRVLGEKLVSTLQVIAKDVKIQVEFKPDFVSRYRLIGYENRVMANEDFRDDAKDAGELGAGHQVTALYEVELVAGAPTSGALATVRLRYKLPDGDVATEFERSLAPGQLASTFAAAPTDLRFAAAVTEYAEILRKSKHSSGARFQDVLAIATATKGTNTDRAELLPLVESAKSLWK